MELARDSLRGNLFLCEQNLLEAEAESPDGP